MASCGPSYDAPGAPPPLLLRFSVSGFEGEGWLFPPARSARPPPASVRAAASAGFSTAPAASTTGTSPTADEKNARSSSGESVLSDSLFARDPSPTGEPDPSPTRELTDSCEPLVTAASAAPAADAQTPSGRA